MYCTAYVLYLNSPTLPKPNAATCCSIVYIKSKEISHALQLNKNKIINEVAIEGKSQKKNNQRT